MFQKIIEWFSIKNIKEHVVYKNNKHKLVFILMDDQFKIAIDNYIYMFPLGENTNKQIVDSYPQIENMEEMSTDILEDYLKYNEELEDFEKCKEIKQILDNRQNENK